MSKGARTSGKRGRTSGAPADESHGGTRSDRLRVRAAWMYFIEQMTQNEIAEALGIGRVTVVRMLADARARNEVMITIGGELADTIRIERELEKKFDLERAVVAPLASPTTDPIPAIGAATGAYLSESMRSGMSVGVGWGRTLQAALPFIDGKALSDFRVISILGGVGVARRSNPAEFAWRFAQAFQGDGYLIPAPAVVDSPETKRILIEKCGLSEIFTLADSLDAVLVSVGDIGSVTTFYRGGYLADVDHQALLKRGAVGDLLFHFFDRAGELIDDPINDRVMSIDIDRIRRTPLRILTSGGREKADAMIGAMKLVCPNVLITDEHSARRLLAED
ncbi:MAG: sugar-binding transcriptional regulator [Mesorhizobium sp.]